LATYPIINKETGERKEITMSIDDWDEWKSNNRAWIRDWSDPSTAPGCCEVGEWRDKLSKNHPSWNEVLKKVGSSPGSKIKKI
jgi:hypothetical protein